MSGITFQQLTWFRAYPFSLYCQALNFARLFDQTAEDRFEEAFQHATEELKIYDAYLRVMAAQPNFTTDFDFGITRRTICTFYAVHPDPSFVPLIHVLECEFAAQTRFPVEQIKQFVNGNRGQEVLKPLSDFTTKLIVEPFYPMPLEDIWGGLKFVALEVCGGSEARLIELCSWMNQLTGGRLLSLTQDLLDLEFQAFRLNAFMTRTVTLEETAYQITKILGTETAEGRKFLTCEAVSQGERTPVVLRFGAHPISCPLAQDPQMAQRYAEELDRSGNYAWVYPPLLAKKMVSGVAIYDRLHVVNFKGWKNKPLTFSQKVFAEKVGRFFVRCKGEWKLPRTPEEFKKLGVKPSGEDGAKFWQLAPMAFSTFTWESFERTKRVLADEGITLFQLMSTPLKEVVKEDWPLFGRVRQIQISLIETGALPPLLKDDGELLIAQRNKISAVIRRLMTKNYGETAAAKLIGYWLEHTDVTLVDAWDRLESDIEDLLKGEKDHAHPLAHEMVPVLEKVKVQEGKVFAAPPPSTSDILGEWVTYFAGSSSTAS